MGLSMEDKQAVVTEVAAQVAKAQAIVLAEYRGLEVGHMTELRRKARRSGVYLRVLKNTLARRAVKDTPFSKLADSMIGPLIYGISSDPVAPAKVMNEFAKGNEKFVIRAGCDAERRHLRQGGCGARVDAVSARSCSRSSWARCRPRSPSSSAR